MQPLNCGSVGFSKRAARIATHEHDVSRRRTRTWSADRGFPVSIRSRQLDVVDQVALVKNTTVADANLARQQQVLAGLRQSAIAGRQQQNRASILRHAG